MLAQTSNMEVILEQSQHKLQSTKSLKWDMQYKVFPTYDSQKPSEVLQANTIKNSTSFYTEMGDVIFLINTDSKFYLELSELDKKILVEENSQTLKEHLPTEMIKTLVSLFKEKKVTDQGDYWLCSLTSDVITQIPYAKVEILINKADYTIAKQTLYFLTEFPYVDSNGNDVLGTPKMEISFFNYSQILSDQEKNKTNLATYIQKQGQTIKPTESYKGFKLIQN